jgi:hypothetical protein
LGFERPRDVRKLIERNAPEIEAFGPMRHRGAKVDIGSGAQREVARPSRKLARQAAFE